ncbi:hypothetical protein GCM10010439_68060 [Actinocorallia aurantiaca]|uniref:Transposase n=1 Tax=Actinocorallia aurantiaca TaxID=46204 RepID=A0ABN3USB2_9ACTN
MKKGEQPPWIVSDGLWEQIEPLLPKVERRRLRDWHEAGVWDALHQALLVELHTARQLDWSRAGKRQQPRAGAQGRPKTGRSPVDRGRVGSKHHVLTNGSGIPLAVSLTGGNRGRRHPARPAAGQGPIGARTGGQAPPQAGEAAGRPGL